MANQIKKKYIQDGAVDGKKLKLVKDQSVRGEDQSGQEVDLLKLDQDDKVLLKGEEAALKSQVDAEKQRAEGEESRIEGKLDTEIFDRQTADTNIQSQITALQGAGDVLFEDDASVYADATAPIEDPTGRDGWYYKSAGSSDKVNWYFHDGQTNPVTVGQWERLYTVATVDSSSNDTFHLAYYTIPLGDGQDAGSWYRSRIVYVPSGNFERGVKTLFYMGQEPDASVYPDLPRVQMTVTSVAGSSVGLNEDTEVIFTSVFGTNSAADADTVKVLVNKLGFNSSIYNKEYSLEIRGEFTLAGIKQSLLEEAIARQNADGVLQDNIDVEKARIDAILDASEADKDSFAEIVSLINSVDTENDQAFAGYVSSNDAALAQIETSISQEILDRTTADDQLQANIDSEEQSRIAADSSLQSSLNSEQAARISQDGILQDNIDDEQTRAETAEANLQSNIDAEESARQAADTILQSNIDTEKARIDAILNASTADADSFKEIVDLINSVDTENDQAFAGYVSSNDARVDNLESEMDAVEASVTQEALDREAADDIIDGRLSSLESYQYETETKTLTQEDLVSITFDKQIIEKSMVLSVGRLMLIKSIDYSLEVMESKAFGLVAREAAAAGTFGELFVMDGQITSSRPKINLVTSGNVYLNDDNSSEDNFLGSVWRIDNTLTESKVVTFSSYNNPAINVQITVPANSRCFILSPIRTTHKITGDGVNVAKSANTNIFGWDQLYGESGTKLTFIGSVAQGGEEALAEGEVLQAVYEYKTQV